MTCLHALDGIQCSSPAIGSHLVSREAFLAPIATDRHVYTFKSDMDRVVRSLDRNTTLLSKVGVNVASVFPGFCATHDQSLFRILDASPTMIGHDEAIALAYRALVKHVCLRARIIRDADLLKKRDSGRNVQEQLRIQNAVNRFLHDWWLGKMDSELRKSAIECIMSGSRPKSDFEFQSIVFDRILPVVACGGSSCQTDFAGRGSGSLLEQRGGQVPVLMHALIPARGRSVSVMAWARDGFEDRYREVASSVQVVPLARVPTALCRYTIDICEDFYISPSWYDGLSHAEKLHLDFNLHMVFGIPHGPRCVFDSPVLTIAGRVEQLHRSWEP
jgi:hypothetical protein